MFVATDDDATMTGFGATAPQGMTAAEETAFRKALWTEDIEITAGIAAALGALGLFLFRKQLGLVHSV
jgi:hypothetical protein